MMDIQNFYNSIEKEHDSSFYRHINVTLKKNKKGEMDKISMGEKNNLSVKDIGKKRYGWDPIRKRVLKESECNTLSLAVKHIPDLYVVDFDTKEVVDCKLYDLLNNDCVAFTPTTKGSHYYIKIKNIGEYPAFQQQQKIYIDNTIDVDLIKKNNIWETKGRIVTGEIKEYDWNDIKKYFNVTKMNFSNSPPVSPPQSGSEEDLPSIISSFEPLDKEYDIEEIRDHLDNLNNKECFEYDTWIKIGMAIHTITNGDDVGLGMFIKFSKEDEKGADLERINYNWKNWNKKGTKVGLTTLRKLADKYRLSRTCEEIFRIYVEKEYEKNTAQHESLDHSRFFEDGRKKVLRYMNQKVIYVDEQCEYIILDHKKVRKGDKIITRPCWYSHKHKGASEQFVKENFSCQFNRVNALPIIFKMKPFTEWCEWTHRREVRTIGFDPVMRSYQGQGHGGASDGLSDLFNLWNGFNIQKEEADEYEEQEAEPILKHIREIWCSNDEESYNYILNLFAHYLQKPWKKTGILLALKGKQGSGKGIILDKLASIIGDDHYVQNSNAKFLFGEFNGQLEGKIVCNLDEAFWGGDKQLEGIVKNKITETRQTINKKNKEPYTINCFCNYIITTNNDWFSGCSSDDRRHYCLELAEYYSNSNIKMNGPSTPEKMKIIQPILDAPAEAFAKVLYNRDISEFNPRIFKKTKLLQEQVERNHNSVNTWWNMVLHDGGFYVEGKGKFIEWGGLEKDDYIGDWKGGIWIEKDLEGKCDTKTLYFKDWLFDCYYKTSSDNRKASASSFYRDLRKNCLGNLYLEERIQFKGARRRYIHLPSLSEARKKWNQLQEYDYNYDDSSDDE